MVKIIFVVGLKPVVAGSISNPLALWSVWLARRLYFVVRT